MVRKYKWSWGICAVLLACGLFQVAEAVEPYQEYRKRIESSQNLTALKGDLFGDSVSLFNGKTEFVNTDIDLGGNNLLPVRLQRRFNVEINLAGLASSFKADLEGAGGWDVEVPYIAGMFQGTAWSDQRCSVSMVPIVNPAFNLTEVWQGNTVHIPGSSDRTMLGLEGATPRPSDGVARRWTTNQRDAFDCIPMRSGLSGEGFRITTTSGERYYFDIAVNRYAGMMEKKLGEFSSARVSRKKIYLLASKVEDRFGNTVQYQYNGDGHPVRIWSSDGREIVLSYKGAHLANASAGGRTWSYGYGDVEQQTRLTSVTLPDGTSWRYSYSNALSPSYAVWDADPTPNCVMPPEAPTPFTFNVIHPSGAVGNFSFINTRHYRSGVHMSECLTVKAPPSDTSIPERYYYVLQTPDFFDVVSLYNKTISGPGLGSPQRWTYSYGGGYQGLWGTKLRAANYPCTTCKTEKVVVVTQPDRTKVLYRYGFQYALNEGRLLGKSTLDANGKVISSSASTYMTTAQVASQPFAPRYGYIYNGDDPSTAQVRPVVKTVVTQEGNSYQLVNNSFDHYARPLSVTRSSP